MSRKSRIFSQDHSAFSGQSAVLPLDPDSNTQEADHLSRILLEKLAKGKRKPSLFLLVGRKTLLWP
jgi:hypothetical protein